MSKKKKKKRKNKMIQFVKTTAKHEIKNIVEPPKIFMSELAHDQISAYVDIAEGEVSWLGEVLSYEKENIKFIKQCFLLDQECGPATTDISEKGLAELAGELLKLKGGMEICNNLLFWGHSHVNMGVSPSSTDDTQMKEFKESGKPFFLRGIFNKRGEVHFDYYDYTANIVYFNVGFEIYRKSKVEVEEIKKEFEKKVKVKVYTPPTNFKGYGGYGDYNDDDYYGSEYYSKEWYKRGGKNDTRKDWRGFKSKSDYSHANSVSPYTDDCEFVIETFDGKYFDELSASQMDDVLAGKILSDQKKKLRLQEIVSTTGSSTEAGNLTVIKGTDASAIPPEDDKETYDDKDFFKGLGGL
jgi:hypothetical protein